MSEEKVVRQLGSTDVFGGIGWGKCALVLLCTLILPSVIATFIIIAGACFAGGENLQQAVSELMGNSLFSMCAEAVASLLSIAVCAIILRSYIKELARSLKSCKNVCFGALLGCAIFGISYLLGLILSSGDNENQALLLKQLSSSPVLFIISVSFITPILEELTFRVAIFSPLKRINLPVAYIASALLFALIHVNLGAADLGRELIALPTYLIAGLGLTFAYHKFGFWGSVSMHMVNNLIAAIISLATM